MSSGAGARMTASFMVKAYNQGQTIFRQGQDGSYACIINSGRVEVLKEVEGQTVSLAVLGKGEVFGEMALIADEKRTATVKALEYTEVVVLDRDRLLRALRSSIPVVQALVIGLVKRLADTSAMVRRQQDQAQRLEALGHLLQAWSEINRTEPDGSVRLPLRRLVEYSRATMQISPPTLESILEDLADSDLLRVERSRAGRQLILKKPDQIARKAEAVAKRVAARQEREAERAAEQAEGETEAAPEERETAAHPEPLDCYRFAKEAGLEPERLWELLDSGELPETMVLFDGELARRWLKARRSQKKPSRPASSEQRLEKLLDDNRELLARALMALGLDRLQVLLSGASPRSRRIILECLPPDLREELPDPASLPGVSPEAFRRLVELLAAEMGKVRGRGG